MRKNELHFTPAQKCILKRRSTAVPFFPSRTSRPTCLESCVFSIEDLQNESRKPKITWYETPDFVNGPAITSVCAWRMSQGEKINRSFYMMLISWHRAHGSNLACLKMRTDGDFYPLNLESSFHWILTKLRPNLYPVLVFSFLSLGLLIMFS